MKIRASSAFIVKDRMTPRISSIGLLTRGLRPLLMAFCITVASLVSLVTREDVSNLSISEKEYDSLKDENPISGDYGDSGINTSFLPIRFMLKEDVNLTAFEPGIYNATVTITMEGTE